MVKKIVFTKTASARQVGILDQDHREDDRGEPARPEPAYKSDRRTPGAGLEHPKGYRNHADDRQAQKPVQDNLGCEVVEHGHKHDGAEEDDRDGTEQAARLLEEECHLAADLAYAARRRPHRQRTPR